MPLPPPWPCADYGLPYYGTLAVSGPELYQGYGFMPVHVNKSGNYVPMLAKSCPRDYPGGYPKSCSYVLAGVFSQSSPNTSPELSAPATHTMCYDYAPPRQHASHFYLFFIYSQKVTSCRNNRSHPLSIPPFTPPTHPSPKEYKHNAGVRVYSWGFTFYFLSRHSHLPRTPPLKIFKNNGVRTPVGVHFF